MPIGSAASPARPTAHEITADRLLGGRSTLYLIGDAKASKLLRPIFLALLSEVVDRAYELANEQGGRLVLPLLLCLDEAGNVAPLPNLAEIASTAPSHNIQLLSIFHDLAQARSRYRQQAETVLNSHRARMLLPGVADLDTLRYFSGLVGEQERRDLTRTTGSGGSTRSVGRRRTPLVAAEALRQLPEGHALLLYGRLAPARVRLRTWFGDRRLRRLAAAGVSGSDDDWQAPSDDPNECRQWYEDLWAEVCLLLERYRLPVRTGWWQDAIQVEALAALAAWVENYDNGVWDDPPGKLALLYDLERIGLLLRERSGPFLPRARLVGRFSGGCNHAFPAAHPTRRVGDDQRNRSGGTMALSKHRKPDGKPRPAGCSSGASPRQARAAALHDARTRRRA